MSKDIFDLFRENQDKLNQKPSPKTWSRIERRIQSPQPIANKRRPIRRMRPPMGIAAALALIIGLMVAFLWVLGNEKERKQRIFAQMHPSFEIEELTIETSENAIKAIKITAKTQQLKPLKPINEGRIDQKLMVSISKSTYRESSSDFSVDSIREERMGR